MIYGIVSDGWTKYAHTLDVFNNNNEFILFRSLSLGRVLSGGSADDAPYILIFFSLHFHFRTEPVSSGSTFTNHIIRPQRGSFYFVPLAGRGRLCACMHVYYSTQIQPKNLHKFIRINRNGFGDGEQQSTPSPMAVASGRM